MAPNATNSIELAVQRQLALMLREALTQDVSVERSLLPSPPEPARVTVLPGTEAAEAEVLFIGNAGRAHRQDEFTVRVFVEMIGDDQVEVEDAGELIANTVEDVMAENPTLGDLDGVAMFGQRRSRRPHDVWQPQAGLYFRLIELTASVTGRYD
jgi:hypothetical protein